MLNLIGIRPGRRRNMASKTALQKFRSTVLKDGGTFLADLFNQEYERQIDLLKVDPVALVIPGAYKEGKIYGFNPHTGAAVPFTFTRASVGSYIDQDGKMKTAAANVPRIDWRYGYPVYLLERSGTNLVTQSVTLTSGWPNSRCAAESSTDVTAFDKPYYKFVATANGEVYRRSAGFASVANAVYRARVWVRAGNLNSCRVGLGFAGDSSGNTWGAPGSSGGSIVAGPGTVSSTNNSLITITGLSTTEDTCVEVYRQFFTDGLNVSLVVYVGSSSEITVTGSSVQVACPQIEQASNFLTSFIETTGSQATRAKESLISDSFISATGVSVYAEMRIPDLYLAGNAVYVDRGNISRYMFRSTGHQVDRTFASDNTSQISVTGTLMPGLNKMAASTLVGGNKKISVNGNLAQKTLNGDMGAGSGFRIGPTAPQSMFVRALAFFERQLSDAEHVSITT